jgi:hypothetical protein
MNRLPAPGTEEFALIRLAIAAVMMHALVGRGVFGGPENIAEHATNLADALIERQSS